MRKFRKYIILAVCLVIMIFTLTACNPYEFSAVGGGNPNAPTESNGGQIVKQGNKLYIVNGKSTKDTANKFGEVLKGGIIRVTINDDGTLGKDYVTIVPKNIYSEGDGAGIYIFGNYIYYLTPCNEVDKNDKLLNDRLDVMKVKIDGTGTVRLGTIMGLDFQYKFIDGYFIYYKDKTITIKKTTDDFPTVKTIENVTGILMPKNESYEKGKEYIADYIFYTRDMTSSENTENAKGNLMYAIKCDGTNEVQILGKDTFLGNDVADENKNQYRYTTSLKNYLVQGDKITVYYTRKDALGLLGEKTYAYTFTKDSLKEQEGKSYFDTAQEKLIAGSALSSFTPYGEDSVIVFANSKITMYQNNVTTELAYIDEEGSGTASITFMQFRDEVVGEDNVVMMYYTTSKGMYKKVFARNGEIVVTEESQTKIFDTKPGENVFGNEFIGAYYYFNNGDKYDYVYRINLNEETQNADPKEDDEENKKEIINPELVGKMTDADIKQMEEDAKKDKK